MLADHVSASHCERVVNSLCLTRAKPRARPSQRGGGATRGTGSERPPCDRPSESVPTLCTLSRGVAQLSFPDQLTFNAAMPRNAGHSGTQGGGVLPAHGFAAMGAWRQGSCRGRLRLWGSADPCSPTRSQTAFGWVNLACVKQLGVLHHHNVGYSAVWWGESVVPTKQKLDCAARRDRSAVRSGVAQARLM